MSITSRSVLLFLILSGNAFSQSLQKGDIILNGNIGVPHLYKNIIKVAAKSDAFKKNFEGKLEISDIKGLNPIAVKGEYCFNDYFSLGVSTAFWNIRFDVRDYYNIQNQSQGTTLQDSLDIYSFKISSRSFGIRPNFHVPFKNRSNDLYAGIGLGFTSNKLGFSFGSTDIGRAAKGFDKKIEGDLSLPGGVYFAPTIGFRHYFGENVGLNFELGYEKGAIVLAGIVIRFTIKKE